MKTLFFVCPVILFSSCLLGQSASTHATRDDILKLLTVMDTRAQVRQTMEQVMAQSQLMAHQAIKKRHPEMTEEQLARMDKESAEIARTYPVDSIIDDMIPVYQKYLTKADVDAMIAFYSSSSGKKILHDMPAIMSESMQAVYPRLQKNMDDILRRMDEKAEQEEKKSQPKKD
jgi:uncharacterized protein